MACSPTSSPSAPARSGGGWRWAAGGAEAGQVRRMVVAQGAKVVGIGAAIGIATALASTRALRSMLFGVDAMDVSTFVAMSASMIVVGLLASYVPARRASSVDAIESLRRERGTAPRWGN